MNALPIFGYQKTGTMNTYKINQPTERYAYGIIAKVKAWGNECELVACKSNGKRGMRKDEAEKFAPTWKAKLETRGYSDVIVEVVKW